MNSDKKQPTEPKDKSIEEQFLEVQAQVLFDNRGFGGKAERYIAKEKLYQTNPELYSRFLELSKEEAKIARRKSTKPKPSAVIADPDFENEGKEILRRAAERAAAEAPTPNEALDAAWQNYFDAKKKGKSGDELTELRDTLAELMVDDTKVQGDKSRAEQLAHANALKSKDTPLYEIYTRELAKEGPLTGIKPDGQWYSM